MAIWGQLGVNLSNVGAATTDVYRAALNAVKPYTNKVRIHLPDYQDQSALDRDQAFAAQAVAQGFIVVWGISSNRFNNASWLITQRNWPTFRQKLIDYAAIAQSIGITEYQVGNEEESHIYAIPTTMSRTSNVVTAVLPFTPDYQAGDTINVENANPTTFNGTFTLTSNTSGTLVWSQTGTNGSATGSKVTDFTKTQLRTNLRGVVASVKGVFSGIVSTAIAQTDSAGWASDATMGSFDFLTFNDYGENSMDNFYLWLKTLTDVFPAKVKVSEFNLNGSWAGSVAKGATVSTKGFDKSLLLEMQNRVSAMRSLGVPEAYFFTWQNTGDSFAIKQADGGYRALFQLYKSGRRAYAIGDY